MVATSSSVRSNGAESSRNSSLGTSASRQFPGVGDLAAANRPNLGSLDGCDSSRVAVQGGELHLEGLAVLVDMNHGSDVANLQTFLRYWRRQDNSVVFCDHAEVSLLARIGRHQARRFEASIDDPDGPHH